MKLLAGNYMTINLDNTEFHSSLSGLANSSNIDYQLTIAPQTLSANEIRIVGTPTITIDNANSISSVMVNIGPGETVWRPIFGYMKKTFKVSGSPTLDMIFITKYVGTTLTITILYGEDTGLTQVTAVVNLSFRINTYKAPF
jgi:ABC-type uncharacterized transport system YnjBCD ATPase subunit